jgi:hypothetical protein
MPLSSYGTREDERKQNSLKDSDTDEEVTTRNLPGGKERPARKTDSLTALWVSMGRYRDSFTFTLQRWSDNLRHCVHAELNNKISIRLKMFGVGHTCGQTIYTRNCLKEAR